MIKADQINVLYFNVVKATLAFVSSKNFSSKLSGLGGGQIRGSNYERSMVVPCDSVNGLHCFHFPKLTLVISTLTSVGL